MKYIVLGAMRSGTSVVNESLELHPDLAIAYEALHYTASVERTNIPDIRDVLDELYGFRNWPTDSVLYYKWQPAPDAKGDFYQRISGVSLEPFIDRVFERYNGFKILYSQLGRNSKVWDYLLSYPDLKVIHIRRKNFLDSLVSLHIAHSSGDWQRQSLEKPQYDSSFHLNPRIAEEYFYSMDFETEHYMSMFKDNSITIEYDDLFRWEDTIFRIQDFLGVRRQPLPQKYSKRNNKKPSQIVTNYTELYHQFHGTKWACHFEEIKARELLL